MGGVQHDPGERAVGRCKITRSLLTEYWTVVGLSLWVTQILPGPQIYPGLPVSGCQDRTPAAGDAEQTKKNKRQAVDGRSSPPTLRALRPSPPCSPPCRHWVHRFRTTSSRNHRTISCRFSSSSSRTASSNNSSTTATARTRSQSPAASVSPPALSSDSPTPPADPARTTAKAPSVRRACAACHAGKTRCSESLPCQASPVDAPPPSLSHNPPMLRAA